MFSQVKLTQSPVVHNSAIGFSGFSWAVVSQTIFFDLNSADMKLTTLPLLPQGSGGDKEALC